MIRDYVFTTGISTSTVPSSSDPSASADLVNKGYADKTYAHGIDTIANLKAVAAASRTDNLPVFVDELSTWFVFDAASSATGDDLTVITPTAGTGRWIRAPFTNVILSTTGSISVGSGVAANSKSILDLTSTTKGFLPPRMTTTQRDAITSPVTGLVVFNTTTAKLQNYNGSGWADVGGSGGGGGGSLQWFDIGNAPVQNNNSVGFRTADFGAGLTQEMYAAVKVPSSYVAGSQIQMLFNFYSPDSSGTALIQTVTTLIRSGTDAYTSTTNQRTSTNSAVSLGAGTVNIPQSVTADLSSSSGQINSVSIAPSDLLLVKMTRGTDTGTSDLSVLLFGIEVKFA